MKEYLILADCVTGKRNTYHKGHVVSEDKFITDHIPDLIKNKSIELYVVPVAVILDEE